MQAIVKMALEPEWESRFEANSYGFRPGRCTMDAVAAIHHTLAGKGASGWILDADISGCFDNIDHEALLAKLPVFTTILRRWLKAGVVEFGKFAETNAGTPQGGIASPLLANVALDGMERLFGSVNSKGTQLSPALKRGKNKGIGLVRYADDFVVTAPSREVLENYVRPVLDEFLAQRGLKLSEAKTKIVHVGEGFNFLGFTIRRFGKMVLTKPQKEKVLLHLQGIRDFLVGNRTTPTQVVIDGLNPVIRGWSAYYRYGVSKATLQYADHRLWQMLWRWSVRRHRNKPRKWVKARYFTRVGNRDWVFFGQREHAGKRAVLASHADTSVKRYFKVHRRMTPMNPEEREYWAKRKRERLIEATYWKGRRHLLERQGTACALCGVQFDPEQDIHFIDRHHNLPRQAGGTEHPDNLMAVHRWCHRAHHMRSGYRAAVA